MDKDYQNPAMAFTGLFHKIISDIKSSGPVWEELGKQSIKLQTQLKNTVLVLGSFLDAFQKVADLANSSPGATRDIGAGLTRLCLRHRSLESKLKSLACSLSECLTQSLQESVEEWKRNAAQLDKDHSKEYKKAQQEIKKASSETLRLKKKASKKGGQQKQDIGELMEAVEGKVSALEQSETLALKSALSLQHAHFCNFFHLFNPILVKELEILGELDHMRELMDNLTKLSDNKNSLQISTDQVILDLKTSSSSTVASARNSVLLTEPLGSQVSLSSQHSSQKSAVSESSSSLQSIQSAQQHQPTNQIPSYINQTLPSRHVSSSLAGISSIECTRQMASVSSQDSGFVSQEIPAPLPDLSSPLTRGADPHPPRSFIQPNLNMDYADSPDRVFLGVAVDGGLAAAAAAAAGGVGKRPHTISSGYGGMKARSAVAADVFQGPQQPESNIEQAPYSAAETVRYRTTMTQNEQQQIELVQSNGTVGGGSVGGTYEEIPENNYSCSSLPRDLYHHVRYDSIPVYDSVTNSARSSTSSDQQYAQIDSLYPNRCSYSNTSLVSPYSTSMVQQRPMSAHHMTLPHPENPYRGGNHAGSTAHMRHESHYAVPAVPAEIRRSVTIEGDVTKPTADIYARPSLLSERRPGAGPVPVTTPVIPDSEAELTKSLFPKPSEEISDKRQSVRDNKKFVPDSANYSLPHLKSESAMNSTECINLNVLLESFDNDIFLTSNSSHIEVATKEKFTPNQGPVFVNGATSLPLITSSVQQREAPGKMLPPFPPPNILTNSKPPVFTADNDNNIEDFPPPPPSLLFNDIPEELPSSSVNQQKFAGIGNGEPGHVMSREQELEIRAEEGSLLEAIRGVKLRKTVV